ncbi:hypothetical protein ScPMuIL_009203 [Solemya velum]
MEKGPNQTHIYADNYEKTSWSSAVSGYDIPRKGHKCTGESAASQTVSNTPESTLFNSLYIRKLDNVYLLTRGRLYSWNIKLPQTASLLELFCTVRSAAPVNRAQDDPFSEIVQVHQIDGRTSRRHKRSVLNFPGKLVVRITSSSVSQDVLNLEKTQHMMNLPPIITLSGHGNVTTTLIWRERAPGLILVLLGPKSSGYPKHTYKFTVAFQVTEVKDGTYMDNGELYEIKPVSKTTTTRHRFKREDHVITKVRLPVDFTEDFVKIRKNKLRVFKNEVSESWTTSEEQDEDTNFENLEPAEESHFYETPQRVLYIEYLVITDYASFQQWASDTDPFESDDNRKLRMWEFYAQTVNGVNTKSIGISC